MNKISLKSRTNKHNKLTKQEINQLVIEMENVVNYRSFVENEAIFFTECGINYRVFFTILRETDEPDLFEYRIRRSNKYDYKCEGLPLKQDIKQLFNTTTEPIWIEDFFYYPKGHNNMCDDGGRKDIRIGYLKKETYTLI